MKVCSSISKRCELCMVRKRKGRLYICCVVAKHKSRQG
jgi:ribosomal protein L36